MLAAMSLASLGEGGERRGAFLSSCSLHTHRSGPAGEWRGRRSLTLTTCSLGSGLDGLGGDRRRSSETLYHPGHLTRSGENAVIIVVLAFHEDLPP